MNRSELFFFGDSGGIDLLKRHIGQQQFFDILPDYTFFVIPCARRFGKTSMVCEVENPLIETAFDDKFAIITPESKDADPLWHNITEKFASKIKQKNGTNRRIKFTDGGVLEFWSIPNKSKMDAARGRHYQIILYEETQKFKDELVDYHFKKVVLPFLLDYPDSKVIFLGTPNGKDTFFHKMAQRGAMNGNKLGLLGDDTTDIPEVPLVDGVNKNANYITMRRQTIDNPHITKERMDMLRGDFDEQTALQELDARFVDYAGEVWCQAIKKQEVQRKTFKTGLEINWRQQIFLSFDFNKRPQTAIMFQLPDIATHERFIRGIEVVKEFRTNPNEHATIFDTIRLIQLYILTETGVKVGKWYNGKKDDGSWNLVESHPFNFDIMITGDASGEDNGDGKQRTPMDYYEIISEELNLNRNVNLKIPTKNPYHADSYAQTNFYLEKHPHFFVDEKGCPFLKNDMLNVKSDKFQGIDKSDALLTHSLDNLRYGINTFKPLIEIQKRY